jgi:TRAP-type C4-dicarboxylate transport system permease small subunit
LRLFDSINKSISSVGAFLAGAFLLGMMVLTVANVIFRIFGHVIAGTYEMTEVMNVIVIGCAFGYAVLHGQEVTVELVFSRLPTRVREFLRSLNNLLGALFWWIVALAGYRIMVQRWFIEKTELLEVPFFPFRLVWVCGLVFAGMVCLTKLLRTRFKRKAK